MFQTQLVPIFDDNYVFILKNLKTREAIVVDPGESAAVIRVLEAENLKPVAVIITHHHPDHIDGITDLKQKYKMPVYAPLTNKSQIPAVDFFVEDQRSIQISDFKFQVMGLPGHTVGHIAFWFAEMNWLFSGDVIFGLGCGRLFEGTPEQAYASIQKIKSLPDDTLVFCTHEYTETNLRFCQSLKDSFSGLIPQEKLLSYSNQLKLVRSSNQPSVPLHLDIEKKTNPFLIAKSIDEFRSLRQLRNIFR